MRLYENKKEGIYREEGNCTLSFDCFYHLDIENSLRRGGKCAYSAPFELVGRKQ